MKITRAAASVAALFLAGTSLVACTSSSDEANSDGASKQSAQSASPSGKHSPTVSTSPTAVGGTDSTKNSGDPSADFTKKWKSGSTMDFGDGMFTVSPLGGWSAELDEDLNSGFEEDGIDINSLSLVHASGAGLVGNIMIGKDVDPPLTDDVEEIKEVLSQEELPAFDSEQGKGYISEYIVVPADSSSSNTKYVLEIVTVPEGDKAEDNHLFRADDDQQARIAIEYASLSPEGQLSDQLKDVRKFVESDEREEAVKMLKDGVKYNE
ncbi:hypothetical protein [Micrococcoides hystricis]|uniref:Lipoprotein n=1 Tax=Micrococcoides hystricis TaxID=1572761 RepID=A0ABV6PA82_9MICC